MTSDNVSIKVMENGLKILESWKGREDWCKTKIYIYIHFICIQEIL